MERYPAVTLTRRGAMRHLFVTVDYPPALGGMSRRHVETCRRLAPDHVTVSTVADPAARAFDAGEPYAIARQPFAFAEAKLLPNLVAWGSWLARRGRAGVDVVHSGNLRPSGYAVLWAARRCGLPFLAYVNGADLLLERRKAARSRFTRAMSRHTLSRASRVVANSHWTAALVRDFALELGVARPAPVEVIELGTDPVFFRPGRDTGALRRRWGLGERPLLLTVARLVSHKGQDVALRALRRLRERVPGVHYVVVGEGAEEARLRALAAELGVGDAVTFAGALGDDEIAEAYATSDVYVGLSREEGGRAAEGFGISFVEAAASGTPAVAGDSGGVRSAVRDGETGVLVPPCDDAAAADAIARLLEAPARRAALGRAARRAVETHYNWERVAAQTRAVALAAVAEARAARSARAARRRGAAEAVVSR